MVYEQPNKYIYSNTHKDREQMGGYQRQQVAGGSEGNG